MNMKHRIALVFAAMRKRWFVFVLLPLLVLGGGWYLFGPTSPAEPEILVVRTGTFVDQVSISGTVVAAQDVDLGFAQSGRIASLSARVGQQVGAGTVLASIENGDLRATVAQRKAALQNQQAKLAALKVGTRPEEVAVKQSALASAEVALQNAIDDGYRAADDAVRNKTNNLFTNPSTEPQLVFSTSNSQLANDVEGGRLTLGGQLTTLQNSTDHTAVSTLLAGVSDYLGDMSSALAGATANQKFTQADITAAVSAVGTARTNTNTAITALASALAALKSAERDLALSKAGSTKEDIDAQAAQVAAAEADVQSAQAQLQKTIIVAPFSGVVTKVSAKIGQLVSPDAPEISMASNGAFQIESYIPEVSIAKVAVGNPASTTLDAYGSATFAAHVVAIELSRTVRDGISTYKTTLQFDRTDPRIKSGMTADVSIRVQEKANVLSIPKAALYSKADQSFVQVRLGEENTEERAVATGLQSLERIEITSGLHDGDSVVLNPAP